MRHWLPQFPMPPTVVEPLASLIEILTYDKRKCIVRKTVHINSNPTGVMGLPVTPGLRPDQLIMRVFTS